MGRDSDKSKQRRERKKEEKKKSAEYVALVKAAKAQKDPLERFGPFKKFDREGAEFVLTCCRADDLTDDLKEWVFELTERNMMKLYEVSNFGWDPVDKKEDLYHQDAWYLLAHDEEDLPVGFICFRFDVDYDLPVLYNYEVQLEKSIRRHGLGRHMMTVLELIAFSAKMHKVVLTCFKHNKDGQGFFRALGYSEDETSPIGDDDVGYGEGVYDYDILSKPNKKMMEMEKKATAAEAIQRQLASVTLGGN